MSISKDHSDLTPERHIWACANTVLRQHGNRAPIFVAERIGALALTGDSEGVAMWKQIAARLDRLIIQAGTSQ